MSDGREELEVRVAQAPADGAANEAVLKLLASALNISRSKIEIVSGQASRHKRLLLPLSKDEIRARLAG